MNLNMKKKISFISGNFNILHPGHLRLLGFAKSISDKLIVGVNSNKIAGINASVDEKLRLETVKSCSYVDEAILIKKSLKTVLLNLKPNIIVKGNEYKDLENEESKIIKKINAKLVFSSGDALFSSKDLIEENLQFPISKNYSLPKEFLKNHKIKLEKLVDYIKKIKSLNVAVIGDLIIDEYINCDPLGMSQEDSTVVVKEVNKKSYVGGAGIVALHASSIGSKVDFYSVVGKDSYAKFAKNKLKGKHLNAYLYTDPIRPTSLKKRYKTDDKTMLRVSKLYQNSISKKLQDIIFNKLKRNIKFYDAIIFSDFNYGCLPQDLVKKIIKLANKHNVMMTADSQSSSQFGNISRFKGMKLISPTEREARIACRNNEDGLIGLTEKLREESRATNIFIKLGSEGILIDTFKNTQHVTDRIPKLNNFPVDVIGAGDALLATSSLLLAAGANIWESSLLGSISAAIQVSKRGNTPIKNEEIIKNLK
ncbi:MAG: ADP-heptose synthase [Crocinitomicaceae bacterium]|nr:ADP-heptose synthase [Crocinitomicaceae bacterium]